MGEKLPLSQSCKTLAATNCRQCELQTDCKKLTLTLRILNFIVGLLLTSVVHGQQLIFNAQPVDTISIVSSEGYYHFDDKGTTTNQSEHFIIIFDHPSNNYIFADYKSVFTTWTRKPDSSKDKTKHKTKGQIIERSLIDSLLQAFSARYFPPTFKNLGLEQQVFSKLTDEKHIRKLAKIYKADWHFKMSYTSKEKNEIIFKGCQSHDSFNLFLSSFALDTSGYVMVTDYSDEINVFISTGTNKYSFEGHYPNKFKQPWYDHSDTIKQMMITPKDTFYFRPTICIFNFNINRYLVAILPVQFYRRRPLELQSLTNEYIKWYLQRRELIYSYE